MRRLFLDIETSPNLGFFWSAGFKLNVSHQNIVKERRIICVCWKFQGEKQVKFLTWDKNQDNKKLIQNILPVLNESDEIVTHNGENFDIAWIRTMATLYDIPVNPHFKIIDTCLFAKKKLYLNSNKLEYLAEFLKVGHKIKTEFNLWKEVVAGDKHAMSEMVRYCKMDVILLEKVYHRLSKCMPAHTHSGVLDGNDKWTCPHCGSADVFSSKPRITAMGTVKNQMQCKKCFKYYTISQISYSNYLKAKKKDRLQLVANSKKI